MQNMVVGEHLSEWHSGYRAYSVQTLAEIPFEGCSDDYNFDTQIILQLHEAKRRIIELPIPTFYGDEISYVNGMKYARQCAIDVARYRAQRSASSAGSKVARPRECWISGAGAACSVSACVPSAITSRASIA